MNDVPVVGCARLPAPEKSAKGPADVSIRSACVFHHAPALPVGTLCPMAVYSTELFRSPYCLVLTGRV